MLYVFTSMHNLSFADKRAEIFEEHKAYVHGIGPQIRFAGPMLQDDGVTMIGGMVVAEGTPEHVASVKESYTGQYLGEILESNRSIKKTATKKK